jgi:hypothetical protein
MKAHHLRGLGALFALAAVLALVAPAIARADAVTDWNATASTAIVTTAGQPPPAAALSFAMVQGAVYDAVNGVDRGHRPYLTLPFANPWDSKDAAAATAAYKVLVGLFPGQLGTLKPLYDGYVAALPDVPAGAKAGGVAAGEVAAAAMLKARENDGRNPPGPFPFVFGTEPGQWRLAPPQGPAPGIVSIDPTPWVGNVKPFLVPDVSMLRTAPPNPVGSQAYTKDYNEVKRLGSLDSTQRTADQTAAAIFWQDHAFAMWNRAIRSLASPSDTAANARLFAATNLASADAVIGCWNNKYHWNFWRPITAIREGDNDGNEATKGDSTWTPLFDPTVAVSGAKLVTPGFPDHPSGHSCSSSAITHTLRNFFGTDKVTFTVTSNKCLPAPCTPRTFKRFSDAIDEVVDARVWGGIHFRTADTEGAKLGRKVARYLRTHYLQAVR